MKNSNVRNLVLIIGAAFFVSFLFSLSFTVVVNKEQKNAKVYAQSFSETSMYSDPSHQCFDAPDKSSYVAIGDGEIYRMGVLDCAEKYYLDSVAYEPVYTPWIYFGKKSYTLSECQDSELKLGLDLQGGMNVTLEISMKDILLALSGKNQNSTFNQALYIASEKQKESQSDYLELFENAFQELNKNAENKTSLLAIFGTKDLREKILEQGETDADVMSVVRAEVEGAVDRAFLVLRARIDKFGVAQPSIQKETGNTGRIVVELPGVKDVERVEKLLKSTAILEFWETYDNTELFEYLQKANLALNEKYQFSENDNQNQPSVNNQDDELGDLLLDEDTSTDTLGTNSNILFDILQPQIFADPNNGSVLLGQGPVIGSSLVKDTAKVNDYIQSVEFKNAFPAEFKYLEFLWTAKPVDEKKERVQLIAIKSNYTDEAKLSGNVIADATQERDQYGNPQINMRMDRTGARKWQNITKENIGKSVAVVLDDFVYSFPTVQAEISGGNSVISGDFTLEEAQDLANILKAGKLPAPARIIRSEIVGPSLGAEAIQSGYKSFLIALAFILLYMIFYYMHAGLASNVALLVNMFFIFGALSGLGGVLTLPGIAGIVLTIGMSVDANVLIYERIREELYQGKGLALAIRDGYSQAYSSIMDANLTTLLTGVVLFYFGSGPIKGFATTLIIGILTSLFCAIFITRLIFESRLNSKRKVSFSNFITHNAFKNLSIGFLNTRKRYYVLSAVIIALGLTSLFTRGLNQGVDFKGGRSYVVRFEEPVKTNEVRNILGESFVSDNNVQNFPEVKTFGTDKQVKITTSYMMNEDDADNIVRGKLDTALVTLNNSYEVMYTQLVGPTIADDIKKSAVYSILFSLILIFLYILIRFKKWQYSLGAVVAVFHDVIILLSIFSIFYGMMPFSLEIDQAFIAAILTVIGYSLNDTVVVFDRIREYIAIKPGNRMDVINNALNSTLSRTINTSLTTFFVLLVIFIFGGEMVRGFMFAIMIGVVVGTYSSLFIASPIMYDTTTRFMDKK